MIARKIGFQTCQLIGRRLSMGYPSTKDVVDIAGSLYSVVKSVLILNLQLVQTLLPTSQKAPLKLPT